MKKMKCKSIRLVLILLLTVNMGCSNNWIEVSPRTVESIEDAYQTPEDIELAMGSAYFPMTLQHEFDGNNTWYFRWYIGDVCSDDAFKGGDNDGDQPFVRELEYFRGTPLNTVAANFWRKNFLGVFRANTILEQLEEIEINEGQKLSFAAEAKFLRAFYYFDLVRLFGGVPKIDRVLDASEFQQAKAPRDTIYALIITDLKAAIQDLEEKSAQKPDDYGRATKGAARAMLAKSYMEIKDFTLAKEILEELIASNEYSLSASFESIWQDAGEHGPGSIFEINYVDLASTSWVGKQGFSGADANPGNATPMMQRARGDAFAQGWGFNIPTQNLVDEFEANDPRYKVSIFEIGDDFGSRGTFTEAAQYKYYTKKYFNEADIAGQPELSGGNNDRIIRYSDMLLLYAEALYALGDEINARAQVNKVRTRARGDAGAGVLPDITDTGEALKVAIRHERRVELALEGHRYYDIIRWDIAPTVLKNKDPDITFDPAQHKVLPIPQSEVDLSGGILRQNPGY